MFTVVGTADAQTASSTLFDIFNRGLNFAPSDFDRTHVIQGQWVVEMPFGRGAMDAAAPTVSDAGTCGVALNVVVSSLRAQLADKRQRVAELRAA